ncbi:hypothetical protein QM012_007474 [Aureobasidium pullulans]|uniref:Uncharacterized protein n=1 Tax=Aureobasidium pullulans TaxID=5580 RepID=A0ABR0TNC6_AURPU
MFAAYPHTRRHPYGLNHQPPALARSPRCETPCECKICKEQFRTMKQQYMDRYSYKTVVGPAAAQTSLAKLTSKINDDRAHLTKLCDKYGNTIISRWRKKSREKREAILLLADQTIENDSWFRLRTEGQIDTWQDLRKYRKCWLLPYLSIEALKANPSALLSLLHRRIFYSPEEWMPFDSAMIRQGWDAGLFDLEYCGKYGVIMHGVNYGKLVPWIKDAAERCDMVGYPRARLIIEAQALMFSRLRAIMDLILEGVDHDRGGGSDKWQEMIQLGFKQSNNIELWSDYVNQPLSGPPKFDVDYYCSIARARTQAFQDHLWLLQTDTHYFRRYIKVLVVGEVYKTVWRSTIIAKDIHLALTDSCQILGTSAFHVETSLMRMHPDELEEALSAISVSTRAEYAEIIENERSQVADAIAAAAAASLTKDATNITADQTLWHTGPDVSKLVIGERTPKPKTRPSQPTSRPAPLEPMVDVTSTIPQRIPATPRALEIIKKMFPTSAEETSIKDVDWDRFVHAMNDLNFNARNVGGSAVAFEHSSHKKIIFHHPHPVAKIDSIMLQSTGKRLNKHFDWSRDAFIGV